ncbi:serine hydrolase [Clostridium sp. MSJ-4]|uniref:Serine hydrolase n=1 Tax=Clostridium simiarum TaxID=2841506 RepID=A0ABS6EW22_9CLOT|nr:serine hydrolase [Clostridium simiarum]MBU5590427.1 serine hydrolase [Clostridium simiarum]
MKKKNLIKNIALALSLSIFSPLAYAKAEPVNVPKIYAKSAVSIDMDTMEVILDYNSENKMYPASTTKLMTGILLAENKNKTDNLSYTKSAKEQPEYSLNTNVKPISIGETMSADDVMKALLLFSANDASYVIADNVGENVDNFIKMMNDKAKEYGMENTNFVTPNGLHSGEHYTTALDLAILGKKAYENSWVRETMALKKASVKTSAGTIAIMDNRNKLLEKNGNIGGKTGYTTPAGKCLVSIYERDGRRIVGVVLNSIFDSEDSAVFNDTEKIIDASYAAKKSTLIGKDEVVETLPIKYKVFRFFGPEKTIDVPFTSRQNIEYYENDLNKKSIDKKIDVSLLNPWKLDTNVTAAKLTVTEPLTSKSYDLYPGISKSDLVKENLVLYVLAAVATLVILALITFIIAAIKRASRKKRRKRYF